MKRVFITEDDGTEVPVREWYFPAEVVAMFYNGEINPRDLVVLGVINTLTHTRGDGSVSWCFASNTYIAKRAGLTANYTSEVICKLIALDIIEREFEQLPKGKKKRRLKPIWRNPISRKRKRNIA